MIVIYTSPGCASCRKAKQWLKDRNIAFIEKNIFSTLLKDSEIKYLLERSENGTDDIISMRSKILKENDIDIDSMSLNELITFIQQNPSVLKRPIIINEKSMLVGYDDDEMTVFNPKGMNLICSKDKCPNYDTCGKLREDEQ